MYEAAEVAGVVPDDSEEPNAWKAEHARKCEVFNEWCLQNGVKYEKI